jgi:hypothetical protein
MRVVTEVQLEAELSEMSAAGEDGGEWRDDEAAIDALGRY